jgi:hypothetical protein
MLFDPDGILINDHAMRPSDKDFDKQIGELIKKYGLVQ